jgi:hypothetical protein
MRVFSGCLLVALGALALGCTSSSANGGPGGGAGDGPLYPPAGTLCVRRPGDPQGCVSSCFAQNPVMGVLSCDPDSCGPGFTLLTDCPAEACNQVQQTCCDLTTGHVAAPPCKADGTHDVCPAGTEVAEWAQCIPGGLDISACNDLRDQPCASPGQECHQGPGFQCTCVAGDAGMHWMCTTYI